MKRLFLWLNHPGHRLLTAPFFTFSIAAFGYIVNVLYAVEWHGIWWMNYTVCILRPGLRPGALLRFKAGLTRAGFRFFQVYALTRAGDFKFFQVLRPCVAAAG